MTAINTFICLLRTFANTPQCERTQSEFAVAIKAFHALDREAKVDMLPSYVDVMTRVLDETREDNGLTHRTDDEVWELVSWLIGTGPKPKDPRVARNEDYRTGRLYYYKAYFPLSILCSNHAAALSEAYDHDLATLHYRSGYYGQCYVALTPVLEVEPSVEDGEFSGWIERLVDSLEAWSDDEIYHRCDDAHYEETLFEAYSEYLVRVEHALESVMVDHDMSVPNTLYATIAQTLSESLSVEECEPGEWYAYCHRDSALYNLIDSLMPDIDGEDRAAAFTALDRA